MEPNMETPPRRGDTAKPVHKGVYLLPNLITSLSMFLGFLSMVWAVQGRIEHAAFAIFMSAIMDGLDGKVARLTHTASEFGVQYDSLADLVAFGLAPAMLMWQWQLETVGRLGVAVAFIYAACGALRLARFNVAAATAGKRFFIGLPIPAAGCTAVTYLFFARMFTTEPSAVVAYVGLLLTLVLGILMVSKVRYFSFKEYDFLRAHPFRVLVGVMLALALVYSQPRIFGFLICAVYILGGIVYTYYLLPKRNRALLRVLPSSGE